MATSHYKSSNRASIAKCNEAVTRRLGVPLAVYKTIKATTQLAAVATGFFAIQQGADPTLTFALVATIVVGPEAAETMITEAGTSDD